jgi:hypothetical protein
VIITLPSVSSAVALRYRAPTIPDKAADAEAQQALRHSEDPEYARLYAAFAQVKALAAITIAMDRLASALEDLPHPPP